MTKKLEPKKLAGYGILAAALVIYPFVMPNSYWVHVAIISMIYIILASSLNLLSGYTGMLSLGQQAMYGIGGYTSALLVLRLGVPFPLAMLCAGLFAMFSAWFIGKVTFRLRSAFFTISTIAFAKILEVVCINWVSLTEGPMGLTKIPPPSFGGWVITTMPEKYFMILIITVLCLFACHRIIHSHVGRVFKCVADSEYVCKSTGANVNSYLMIAVMAGGFMAGIAGSFYAHYTNIISPDMFYHLVSVNLIIMVVGGGLGTFVGPIIGAVVFTLLPETLRFSSEYSYVIYGLLLILLLRFLPGGLVSLYYKFMKKRGGEEGDGPGPKVCAAGEEVGNA